MQLASHLALFGFKVIVRCYNKTCEYIFDYFILVKSAVLKLVTKLSTANLNPPGRW